MLYVELWEHDFKSSFLPELIIFQNLNTFDFKYSISPYVGSIKNRICNYNIGFDDKQKPIKTCMITLKQEAHWNLHHQRCYIFLLIIQSLLIIINGSRGNNYSSGIIIVWILCIKFDLKVWILHNSNFVSKYFSI
jgi:hypothetical protein